MGKISVLAFNIILFVVCSGVSALWQLETIDTDAGELLRDLVVHSQGNLVIVGDDATIFFSENNGETWEEAEIPDVSGFMESEDISIRRIVELPNTGDLLTLGVIDKEYTGATVTGPNGTTTYINSTRTEKWTAVLVSRDGGKSWEMKDKIEEAALYRPFVFSDGQCILYGYADSTYEYRRGGVFALRDNKFSTENGGLRSSWPFNKQVILNERRKIKQYRDHLFSIEEGKVPAVSLDRGLTWSLLQTKDEIDDINGIAVLDDRSMVGACDDGIVIISTDAGMSWESVKIGEEDLNAVHADPRCDWWVVGDEGFIACSQNAGKTWTRFESDSDEDFAAVVFDSTCVLGWILGDDGALVRIADSRAIATNLTQSRGEGNTSWAVRAITERQNWFETVDLHEELVQGIHLEVEPWDVTVEIGEHHYSGDELQVFLPPGKYYLKASKEGYFPEEDSVEVEIGEVENEDIVLRRFKVIVSPSGALIANQSNVAVAFSFQGGILGVSRHSAGLLLNSAVFLRGGVFVIDLAVYYSRRLDIHPRFYVSPFVAVGGMRTMELHDSITVDTSQTPAGLDTLENGIEEIYYEPALHLGVDFNIRKNQNWGFSFKPSLFWTRRQGLNFTMRVGAIFWIL